MAKESKIEWTEATWNPWHGCHKISPGCKNCYMFRDKARWGQDPNIVSRSKSSFYAPLNWTEAQTIFTCSWSDFFIEEADLWRDEAFAIMALTPHHTYQVLTKRPDRMLAYFEDQDFAYRLGSACGDLISTRNLKGDLRKRAENMVSAFFGSSTGEDGDEISVASPMPLPNVWLGVSVEDQKTADERIPLLLQTPAAVRWVSAEPLLGALDLREYLPFSHKCQRCDFYGEEDDFLPDGEVELTCPNGCGDTLVSPLFYAPDLSDILSGNTETQLRWIVAGGESGPKGRPMHPAWTRTIRDQCNAAGVPFFFKQWGDFYPLASADQASQYPHAKMHEFDDGERSVLIGKKAAGRTLDGRTWDELPEVSQ